VTLLIFCDFHHLQLRQ